jgi:hypothetical protein
VTELPTCNLLIGAHRPQWKFRRVGRAVVRRALPAPRLRLSRWLLTCSP